MALAEALRHVMQDYVAARAEPFAGNAMAGFVRDQLRAAVSSQLDAPEPYLVDASAGVGNWARGPWSAVFDRLITTTAQDGYYPVYLFREDMRGVYLSLNQGMTAVRQRYKGEAKKVLRTRAEDFRLQLGVVPASFPETSIDLAASGPSTPTAFYEAGNIVARYYPADSVPVDAVLRAHLRELLSVYESLTANEDTPAGPPGKDDDVPPAFNTIEDLRKYRHHRRLERNRPLAKEAKRRLGYKCQACDFDFEQRYGDIGREYIEAHHLVPIHTLAGRVVRLDPAADFAVLCSNCHRMIHRTGDTSDVAGLRRRVRAVG